MGYAYWPTTVIPDPAAILKGAPNLDEAKLFMDYITSERGQTKVSKYRLPIRQDVTTTDPIPNPFNTAQFPTLVPDYDVGLHNSLFSRIRALYKNWLVTNRDKANEFLAPAWTGDPEPLARVTGWRAGHDLERGLAGTVAWCREHGWL